MFDIFHIIHLDPKGLSLSCTPCNTMAGKQPLILLLILLIGSICFSCAFAKDKNVDKLQIGVKVSPTYRPKCSLQPFQWDLSGTTPKNDPTNCPHCAFMDCLQHKPKDCSRKTKPGDTVHVHYTVSCCPACASLIAR